MFIIIIIIILITAIWGAGIGALYEWDPLHVTEDGDADFVYMIWPIALAFALATSPLWVSVLAAQGLVRKLQSKKVQL